MKEEQRNQGKGKGKERQRQRATARSEAWTVPMKRPASRENMAEIMLAAVASMVIGSGMERKTNMKMATSRRRTN